MLGVEEDPVEARSRQELRHRAARQRAPEADLRPAFRQRPLEPVPRQLHHVPLRSSRAKSSPCSARIRGRCSSIRERCVRIAATDAGDVPGPDGVENDPMIVERRLRAEAEAHEPHPVHVRLLLADQRPGVVVADERADPAMEFVVEPMEALAVVRRDGRRLLAQERLERGQLRRPEPLGREAYRLDLERGADEPRLLHRLLGHDADLGRPLRPDGQEAELREAEEGVAHRLPRHPGGPRHLGLGQARARRQRQRHHLPVERLEHLIGGPRRTHRLEAREPDIIRHDPSVDADCILAY